MKIRHSLITGALLASLPLLYADLALTQTRVATKASTAASQVASAPARDGFNRVMDSQTCTTAPRSDWLPEEEMKLLAEHRGYRIKTFRIDKNNCYEVYGFNRQNQVVEAYFDPVTSRLKHQNIAQ